MLFYWAQTQSIFIPHDDVPLHITTLPVMDVSVPSVGYTILTMAWLEWSLHRSCLLNLSARYFMCPRWGHDFTHSIYNMDKKWVLPVRALPEIRATAVLLPRRHWVPPSRFFQHVKNEVTGTGRPAAASDHAPMILPNNLPNNSKIFSLNGIFQRGLVPTRICDLP